MMTADDELFKARFLLFINLPLSEVKAQVHSRLRLSKHRREYEAEIKDLPADAVRAISARAIVEQDQRDELDRAEMERMIRARSSFPPPLPDKPLVVEIRTDDVGEMVIERPTRYVPQRETREVEQSQIFDVYRDETATRKMPSVKQEVPEPVPSSVRVHPITDAGRYSLPREERELPVKQLIKRVDKIIGRMRRRH